MAKLKNFIENYLKNQKISDYESWLALYGKDGESAFREAKTEADTAYAASRAEYGAKASSLYDKGLSGSGYSDFINHAAYAEKQSSIRNALREKEKTEAENERGYLSYLTGIAEEEEKEKAALKKEEDDIFTSLLSQRILDPEAAITYLTTRGIDEERAKKLAEESVQIQKGRQSYLNQLISEAKAANMNYYTAFTYALAKGLDEETAESVATVAAFQVAKRKGLYTNGYYSYYK